MGNYNTGATKAFNEKVAIKYQLFNSLFTNLPFQKIDKTGVLLSVLQNECEEGYRLGKSPIAILDHFFERHTTCSSESEKIDLMFRIIQFVERQVVLFDALEEAAFESLHGVTAETALPKLVQHPQSSEQKLQIKNALKDFSLHLVLTAHPTQFYPSTVLGIINDLAKALDKGEIEIVNQLLQQLGNTPFFQHKKPTPLDEAKGLIWFLENVFYDTMGGMAQQIQNLVEAPVLPFSMGFWPGGDRDGNPFVTSETTLAVAASLKGSILKCYYIDIRTLRRKLTFKNIHEKLGEIEQLLYNSVFLKQVNEEHICTTIISVLTEIKRQLTFNHNALFMDDVESVIVKLKLFGTHFATLDIRQEASVHTNAIALSDAGYATLLESDKIEKLENIDQQTISDAMLQSECFKSFEVIKAVQASNGEQACNRYIISQCKYASNIMEVLALNKLAGWDFDKVNVDIVPLFETITDLNAAPEIMKTVFANSAYKKHLTDRGGKQTVMLGFSDGTKDGGYIAANYAIFKAKEALLTVAVTAGIEIVFFDGRGGPPSRGGGKTHQYYSSMDQRITKHIQLTVQGQTISSNFGTKAIAAFNISQLCNARLTNATVPNVTHISPAQHKLLETLAQYGHEAYTSLKSHDQFLSYLSTATPVKYYSETNIASRPAKRNNNSILSFSELRAIPYVGAWAQVKQNISGFYGVGTALHQAKTNGQWDAIKELYHSSLFFKTMMDNCEMALLKCFMPLTMYLGQEEAYSELWQMIYDEYNLAKKMILSLNDAERLMSNYPVDAASIALRERIILPVLTIQQYALATIRKMQKRELPKTNVAIYEKIIIRSSFSIINAGRNAS